RRRDLRLLSNGGAVPPAQPGAQGGPVRRGGAVLPRSRDAARRALRPLRSAPRRLRGPPGVVLSRGGWPPNGGQGPLYHLPERRLVAGTVFSAVGGAHRALSGGWAVLQRLGLPRGRPRGERLRPMRVCQLPDEVPGRVRNGDPRPRQRR